MRVDEFYNKFAKSYDEKISAPEIDSKLMVEVANLFRRQKISKGTILDIGCGTGILKTILGDDFQYTGIDISPEMLEVAKKRGYKTYMGDILPILRTMKTNSFEHVAAISVLYWIPNAQEVLDEMYRIAKFSVTATIEKISPIKEAHEKIIDETPIFDHSNIDIASLTEDYEFSAWTSPSTNTRINARMIFYKKPVILLVWEKNRPLPISLLKENKQISFGLLSSIIDLNEKEFFSFVLQTNPFKIKQSLLEIKNFQKNTGIYISAIYTQNEELVWQTAYFANKLSLKSSNYIAVKSTSRNKLKMRGLLNKDTGNPVPFLNLHNIFIQKSSIGKIGFPNIIKPSGGASSLLVFKNKNLVELKENFKKIKKYIKEYSKYYSATQKNPYILNLFDDNGAKKVMLEKFISGEEISVEGFVANGKAIILCGHDKPGVSGEYEFMDNIYSTPSEILKKNRKLIDEIVQNAVHNLGLTDTPFHIEIKFENNTPFIIEIGARFGGGPLVDNVKNAYSVDLHNLYLDYILNKTIPEKLNLYKNSTFLVFQVTKRGVLKSLPDIDEYMDNFPEIEKIKYYVSVGERIRDAKTGMQYLGHAIISGRSTQNNIIQAKKILSKMNSDMRSRIVDG